MRAAVIKTLPQGSFVNLLENIGDYAVISTTDTKEAFVRNKFLSSKLANADEASLRQRIIKNTKSYLGTQYRWGGKTHLGIDCSGLTFMAYRLCGINIWRDAHLKDGFAVKKIDALDAKPADLIFFPGHVAILLEDDRIIHSSDANGKVAIDNFKNNPTSFGSIF